MDRRGFLKTLGIGVASTALAPSLLSFSHAPTQKLKLYGNDLQLSSAFLQSCDSKKIICDFMDIMGPNLTKTIRSEGKTPVGPIKWTYIPPKDSPTDSYGSSAFLTCRQYAE